MRGAPIARTAGNIGETQPQPQHLRLLKRAAENSLDMSERRLNNSKKEGRLASGQNLPMPQGAPWATKAEFNVFRTTSGTYGSHYRFP